MLVCEVGAAPYYPNSYDSTNDAAVKGLIGSQIAGSNYLSYLHVVNVLDFGAVGDGATDNTTAFQNAINSITNTGGVIDVPAGRWLINGSFALPPGSKSLTNFCQLYFPARALESSPITSFWIRGVGKPTINTVWTTNGIPAATTNGTIIITTNVPANPLYSIFGTGAPSTSQYNQSAIYIILDGINIRTYDNPKTTGLNLSKFGQASVRDCVIETGTGGGAQSQATNGSFGLITPEINNWVISEVFNTDIRGYQCGAMFNEHSDIDDVRFWLCPLAMYFPGGTHAIHVGHVVVTGCTRGVTGGTTGGFIQRIDFSSYATEHSILTSNVISGDMTWANTVWDFDDTNNVLRGTANVAIGKSGVGAVDTFLVNPGTTTNMTFFNENNNGFRRLSIRSPGTNEPDANYLFTIGDSNNTPVANFGHYPQPFQGFIGLWMGPQGYGNVWRLATNFTLLTDTTNATTINVGQPEGGNATLSHVDIQVGHQTVANFSNAVIYFALPLNHGFSILTNLVNGKLYTNTSPSRIRIHAPLTITYGQVSGFAAAKLTVAGNDVDIAGHNTSALSFLPTQYTALNGDVLPGQQYFITNNISGATNSVSLGTCQMTGE